MKESSWRWPGARALRRRFDLCQRRSDICQPRRRASPGVRLSLILIDTSGLLAAIDPRQDHHEASARILRQDRKRILSPFVLAELDYLISRHSGPGEASKLLHDVALGAYDLASITQTDVREAILAIEAYSYLRLGLADASIVVLAERLACHDILTLDQRHFRAIPGPKGKPFRLMPFDAN